VLLLLVLGLALPPLAFTPLSSAYAATSLITYAWGPNDFGQLGDGTITLRNVPVQVQSLTDVQQVSAGQSMSLALDGPGHVWAWGSNSLGELGNGDPSVTRSMTPVEVVGPGGSGHLSNIIAIAAGGASSLALASDGTVYAWGWNVAGVLGVSTGTVSCTVILPNDTPCTYVPLQVGGLANVVKIAVGFTNAMALESDGSVWVWGDNVWGELANGVVDPDPDSPAASFHPTPRQVDFGGASGLDIATAFSTDYALIKDCTNPGCHTGMVYAWGHGANGELGNGTNPPYATAPGRVQAAPGLDLDFITSISAGSFTDYAVDNLGFVVSWGAASGALGHDASDSCNPSGACSLYPDLVLTSNDPTTGTLFGPVRSIDGGGAQALALKTDGTFWSWGTGPALGLGSTTTSEFPAQVLGPGGTGHLNGVTAFSAGDDWSLAVAPPLDTTAPVIAPHVSPAPNAAGWNTTSPVTVSWDVSDPESGIASSTGCDTRMVASDTTDMTFTCSATNGAGLSNSQSVTVKLDTVGPLVSCPVADGSWHASDVSLTCTTSDLTSGLANSSDASFALSTNVAAGTETTTAPTGTHQVCDMAGNCTTAGPITGNMIDKAPPTVSCGTADGLWHAADVTIGCTAADGGSGLAISADATFSLSTTVPAGTETAGVSTETHQVCDGVGNCTTAGLVSGIMVDKKAPSITITTPPTGALYTIGQAVPASYTCSDGGSGVATCAGPVASGAALPTSSPGSKAFTVHAADKVGNASTASTSYTVAYAAGTGAPAACILYSQTQAHNPGSTIPIKLELCDVHGKNLSSAAITLTAIGLAPNSGNSNPNGVFRYVTTPAPGGSYSYNLKTTGFHAGTYTLQFTVTGDPTVHRAQFVIG
jgi:alpha-tubulin suppressor-like RCC1 family protein